MKLLQEKIEFKEAEVISLNVGGKFFSTSIDTLRTLITYSEFDSHFEEPEDHLLSAMFSGNYELQKDKYGHIFIDRNPKFFGYILDFLRCKGSSEDFVAPRDEEMKQALIVEARFFHLRKLEHLLNGEYKGALFFPGAAITAGQMKILNNWYGKSKQKWELLYKSSIHGNTCAQFHAKCDNMGPTITIVYSSNGNIFGGYLDKSWNSSNSHIETSNSWLFALVAPCGSGKFKCKQASQAALGHRQYGPCFGSDIQFNADMKFFSMAGTCYAVPYGMYFERNSNSPSGYGTPPIHFEIEVFTLAKQQFTL